MPRRDGLYKREGEIFAFRFKDADGLWREKSTGERDREAARKFKREFEQQLADGTLPTEKADWTVSQAATEWVENHTAHLTSDKAKKNERSYLRQLCRRIGNRRLGTITADDFKRYQRERCKEVGPRPVNLELRILIGSLKDANLWRRIAEHYKPLREPKSEIGRALSLPELRKLEEVASSNDGWFVAYHSQVIACNSGLRGGEIKKLTLAAIDLEKRRIRIFRKSTKTDAGARLVELNQAAAGAVSKLYMRAQALGATEPDHYLLPADCSRHTKAGDPLKGRTGFDVTMHQQSWDTAWRSLRKAAGFEGLRFHDMRWTFISLMAERGVPLPVVMSMVGHMSTEMVRYYTQISNDAARCAVELLDKATADGAPGLWGNLWGKQPAGIM